MHSQIKGLFVLVLLGYSYAYPSGAPSNICGRYVPGGHRNRNTPVSNPQTGPYALTVQPSTGGTYRGQYYFNSLGRVATKPVFRVSGKTSFKPVSSATETSQKSEISYVGSLHTVLSKKQTTKALIRLRGCAGWSASVLFANSRRQVFSRRGPNLLLTRLQTAFENAVCLSRLFHIFANIITNVSVDANIVGASEV